MENIGRSVDDNFYMSQGEGEGTCVVVGVILSVGVHLVAFIRVAVLYSFDFCTSVDFRVGFLSRATSTVRVSVSGRVGIRILSKVS